MDLSQTNSNYGTSLIVRFIQLMASFFCLIVASIDYGKSRVLTFELPKVNKPTCAQPQANTSIIY